MCHRIWRCRCMAIYDDVQRWYIFSLFFLAFICLGSIWLVWYINYKIHLSKMCYVMIWCVKCTIPLIALEISSAFFAWSRRNLKMTSSSLNKYVFVVHRCTNAYIKYDVLLVAFQGLNDKLVFAETLNREFLGLMKDQLKKW